MYVFDFFARSELLKANRRGLNRFLQIRAVLVTARRFWLVKFWGMDIHPTAQLSLRSKLDLTFPIGVHIGANSYVALDALILTHDRTRGLYLHTFVEENCFIGARSILLPGIKVGRGSVVGAGSVVTKSFPPGSLVCGNPAKIIRSGISVSDFGRFSEADEAEAELALKGLT